MTHSFPTRRSSDLREQWAVPLGRWFVRFLKNQGIEGQRLGMHSFRHNFQDRLREAGLHGTPIGQELAGRAKSGNTENSYGSGFSTKALADAMGRIEIGRASCRERVCQYV